MAAPNTVVEVDGPLKLKFNDSPSIDLTTQYPEERVFLAFVDYLQPENAASTSLSSTIDKIVEAFPDETGSGYGYRDLLQVVFDLVEQVPFQHVAHSKLVGALWALRNSEKLARKPGFMLSANVQSSTASFDQAFGERLGDLFGGFEDPESYVNFNAFHARVQNSQLKVPGFWAAASIRAAFAPQRELAQMTVREAYVLGAAQWILWDGQAAMEACSSQHSVEGHPTLQEWSSWRQMFEDFSLGEKVGDECKSICRMVVHQMEELTGGKS